MYKNLLILPFCCFKKDTTVLRIMEFLCCLRFSANIEACSKLLYIDQITLYPSLKLQEMLLSFLICSQSYHENKGKYFLRVFRNIYHSGNQNHVHISWLLTWLCGRMNSLCVLQRFQEILLGRCCDQSL